MRLQDFLAARGIRQSAIIQAARRLGYKLHDSDLARIIKGTHPRPFPRARAAIRDALVELYVDRDAFKNVVELKEPAERTRKKSPPK